MVHMIRQITNEAEVWSEYVRETSLYSSRHFITDRLEGMREKRRSFFCGEGQKAVS